MKCIRGELRSLCQKYLIEYFIYFSFFLFKGKTFMKLSLHCSVFQLYIRAQPYLKIKTVSCFYCILFYFFLKFPASPFCLSNCNSRKCSPTIKIIIFCTKLKMKSLIFFVDVLQKLYLIALQFF